MNARSQPPVIRAVGAFAVHRRKGRRDVTHPAGKRRSDEGKTACPAEAAAGRKEWKERPSMPIEASRHSGGKRAPRRGGSATDEAPGEGDWRAEEKRAKRRDYGMRTPSGSAHAERERRKGSALLREGAPGRSGCRAKRIREAGDQERARPVNSSCQRTSIRPPPSVTGRME